MFVSAQKVFTIFVEKRCKVDEDREMKKCFMSESILNTLF